MMRSPSRWRLWRLGFRVRGNNKIWCLVGLGLGLELDNLINIPYTSARKSLSLLRVPSTMAEWFNYCLFEKYLWYDPRRHFHDIGLLTQVTESKAKLAELKQTLLTVKFKTSVDIKYSRKEHRARVSTLLRVYEQYERQLEGQVRGPYSGTTKMGILRVNSVTLNFEQSWKLKAPLRKTCPKVMELERLKEVEAAMHAQTIGFLEKKRRQLRDELDAWEEK